MFTFSTSAQTILTFDKKNVQCEDKWIAFPMAKDSTYTYGFIYIDSKAGLTFNFEGKFKMNDAGKLIKQKSATEGSSSFVKVRLQPNKTLLAEIPESKFADLELEAIPKWLADYKTDENSIQRLYDWGYRYNGWNECKKALTFLEKAEKIDPNYDGLQTELAYSYNALEEYEKAVNSLIKALDKSPSDCYALKELAYAYRHLIDLKKSEVVYNEMVSACDNKNFVQETAYNMAYYYYGIKDKKNFKKWSKEARKWTGENQYTQSLDQMEKEL
jgi:tetratricopeptide (TPR) repeat protein